MKWDNDASVDFLRKWAMNGPWALTAISTDRRKLTGAIFQPDEEDRLRGWLDDRGEEECNVYFSVNTVTPSKFRDKASREGIDRVTHFHVDIDPRAGEDLEAEQARIEKLIHDPPKGVPAPTWAVFSGGGYQLFWELVQPIEIGGSVDKAEIAKLYNLQLEFLFHADNCHNIDRIMRLPGTINVPDKKKRAKGRTKQLAKVVYFNPDVVHDLADFTKAAGVQQSDDDGSFSNAGQVNISGNIERADSIDVIIGWAEANGHTLSDNTLMLIAQGDDPDDPTKYGGDRSNALFACCCALVRADFTDNQIYAIITDPTWKISESVLDKGSGIERYAKRQIARAREKAIHPWLAKMNKRHAVVRNYGGKTVVMEEVRDPHTRRNNLSFQSFGDIKNSYMHKRVEITDAEGNVKYKPLGKWWLEHPKRMQYDGVIFSPNGEVEGMYNMWQGFACEAIPGECDLLLDHIKNNICGGIDSHYDYLINWMARSVQFPATTGDTAVVLRGDQGTGKGVMIKALGSLFGRHFLQVSNSTHLVGNFNKHLRDCVLLFADEAFFAGDKKHEGVLKALVTEENLVVEAKGVDAVQSPNFIHLMMASNSDWVIPAGINERRFFVLDVKSHHMQDTKYFKKITEQIYKHKGREAFLHFLRTRDLSNFDHRSFPKTDALQEQKELSMSPEESWWYNKLVTGSLLTNGDQWMRRVTTAQMHYDYVNFVRNLNNSHRHAPQVLGRFLKRAMPLRWPKRQQEVALDHITGEEKMQAVYKLPDLDACRDYWDEKFFKGSWITDTSKQTSEAAF